LMQDTSADDDTAIPGISRIPLLGEAFKTRTRQHRKTELVIFIRPTIIRTPSLDGDLRNYRPVLERSTNRGQSGAGLEGMPR
jgi:MSHA biogenesis protein MshL